MVGDEVAWPPDAVEVGRVVDAWGVKGWIKVDPYASDPQALFSSRRWWLSGAPGAAAPQCLRIAEAREHGEFVVARGHDIVDRAGAEALRGLAVFVPRASFPTPEADEYYWVDLIGCRVLNREGVDLGLITGLLETGPTCVLRVGDAPEILIPFVSAYVDSVSLAERSVRVDWDPSD